MAIGAEIAPADPAPIGTVRVRAEVRRGVHLAAAPPRGHDARGRGVGCLWAKVAAVLTGTQCGFVVRPVKGLGTRWRFGTGGVGSGVVEHTAAESLGHASWSITHSHTK